VSKRSKTRPSFFNDRHAAARPITAPFFFESETAGLMFVGHRWLQGFRWWFFSSFSREDAAADYKCGHNRNKAHKLQLLHRGVFIAPTPLGMDDTAIQPDAKDPLASQCWLQAAPRPSSRNRNDAKSLRQINVIGIANV
jgi:hypothetical protein